MFLNDKAYELYRKEYRLCKYFAQMVSSTHNYNNNDTSFRNLFVLLSGYLSLKLGPGPEVIKLFPCSTQLSMKFSLNAHTCKYKNIKNSAFIRLRLA